MAADTDKRMITTIPIGSRAFGARLITLWQEPPPEGPTRADDVGGRAFIEIMVRSMQYRHVMEAYLTLQEMGYVVPESRRWAGKEQRPPQWFQADYWQTIAFTVLELDRETATIAVTRTAAWRAKLRRELELPLDPVGLVDWADVPVDDGDKIDSDPIAQTVRKLTPGQRDLIRWLSRKPEMFASYNNITKFRSNRRHETTPPQWETHRKFCRRLSEQLIRMPGNKVVLGDSGKGSRIRILPPPPKSV